MNPSEIVDNMLDYTTAGKRANMDAVMIAENTIYDVVGFIAGVIVVLITVSLTVITALDIAYITLPTFRSFARERRLDQSKGTAEEKGKYRLISSSARLAVERQAVSQGKETALVMYLKMRVKAYILVGIMIYISIAGTNVLMPLAIKITRGIINAFR